MHLLNIWTSLVKKNEPCREEAPLMQSALRRKLKVRLPPWDPRTLAGACTEKQITIAPSPTGLGMWLTEQPN